MPLATDPVERLATVLATALGKKRRDCISSLKAEAEQEMEFKPVDEIYSKSAVGSALQLNQMSSR